MTAPLLRWAIATVTWATTSGHGRASLRQIRYEQSRAKERLIEPRLSFAEFRDVSPRFCQFSTECHQVGLMLHPKTLNSLVVQFHERGNRRLRLHTEGVYADAVGQDICISVYADPRIPPYDLCQLFLFLSDIPGPIWPSA
jgi:hypothetical protein